MNHASMPAVLLTTFLLCAGQPLAAQEFQVAPLFALTMREAGGGIFEGRSRLEKTFGVGGRFTARFASGLAAEAEISTLPNFEGGDRDLITGLFGGYLSFGRGTVRPFVTAKAGFLRGAYSSGFAFTRPAYYFAGGVDLNTSSRVGLRLDYGYVAVDQGPGRKVCQS